jgi:hypothetical protein
VSGTEKRHFWVAPESVIRIEVGFDEGVEQEATRLDYFGIRRKDRVRCRSLLADRAGGGRHLCLVLRIRGRGPTYRAKEWEEEMEGSTRIILWGSSSYLCTKSLHAQYV